MPSSRKPTWLHRIRTLLPTRPSPPPTSPSPVTSPTPSTTSSTFAPSDYPGLHWPSADEVPDLVLSPQDTAGVFHSWRGSGGGLGAGQRFAMMVTTPRTPVWPISVSLETIEDGQIPRLDTPSPRTPTERTPTTPGGSTVESLLSSPSSARSTAGDELAIIGQARTVSKRVSISHIVRVVDVRKKDKEEAREWELPVVEPEKEKNPEIACQTDMIPQPPETPIEVPSMPPPRSPRRLTAPPKPRTFFPYRNKRSGLITPKLENDIPPVPPLVIPANINPRIPPLPQPVIPANINPREPVETTKENSQTGSPDEEANAQSPLSPVSVPTSPFPYSIIPIQPFESPQTIATRPSSSLSLSLSPTPLPHSHSHSHSHSPRISLDSTSPSLSSTATATDSDLESPIPKVATATVSSLEGFEMEKARTPEEDIYSSWADYYFDERNFTKRLSSKRLIPVGPVAAPTGTLGTAVVRSVP